MPALRQTIKAVLRPGDESGHAAECVEVAVVTQGTTIDETVQDLREAVGLALADEDLRELGLRENPSLVITMETEPTYARAS